jgi:hypothetical protein
MASADTDPPAVQHARAIFAGASEAGVSMKVIGGVGCWLHSVEHSADVKPFGRTYGDVDFVVDRKEQRVGKVLEGLGYKPVSSFNSVQGEVRLMYFHESPLLRIDIFRGAFEMCHTIPLDKQAYEPAGHPVLSLVELLLTKLQIVKCNEKDLMDLGALLAFHSVGDTPDTIDGHRFAGILARDWGLWRTVTGNLSKLEAWAGTQAPSHAEEIASRARELRALADSAPKSTRWKMRARVGERVKWYEEPEEPEVDHATEIH